MRTFAVLYNSDSDSWSVIFRDWGEDEWYVEAGNVGSKENAQILAKAKNDAQRED